MKKYRLPYTGLPAQAAEIKQDLLRAFERVLDSGHYISGSHVKAFEERFAAFCGTRFAVGVGNGTCALHLIWRVLGVGPGDEVITVSHSFVATASSIAMTGARPVFVDIGPDLNIDPECIEAAITPRTRGIVPVHLAGRPAHMVEINKLAEKHGLFVLEDAAQAAGASLAGRRVGSWGSAAGFSLHPLKNLFAYGDGGVITTSDDVLYSKLLMARNHGLRNREQCDFWSPNSRLDELQAAMLLVHFDHLHRWTEQKRALALRYNDLLRPYVTVPEEGPGEYCVYQTYVIQADKRDDLQKFLNENGVEALVHYRTPIHVQPAAKDLGYTSRDLPHTLRACERIMSLPLFPGMTHQQQDLAVDLIRTFHQSHAEHQVAQV
ncbi:MAG TPA: DegT/DnrJ/EryC1/StrS family aminotransferase [Terriglobia bacterium]|nr:DegT/DnrJ/EryC1/StrS family aminotransferase [Terriglobia bacterium]